YIVTVSTINMLVIRVCFHFISTVGTKNIYTTHHPFLGMLATIAYVRIQRQQCHGRGRPKTQTASAAARLFATAELGCPACWPRPRVRRTMSPAPGNSPFVLRQHPQKYLLLPRFRPGRRPPALCQPAPSAVL